METFDYIIVGAGSAGCVLAERLSADPACRVLVLEAGPSDARFWIRTPVGYGRTFADAAVNWKYQTLASPGLNGRTMYWPRGRVVGGSSSINALVYCRGLPSDFDGWRDMGNPGWGWDEVRHDFERSERRVDPAGTAQGRGPLDVKDVTPFLHPLKAAWYGAAAEMNVPVTDDFNGDSPAGFGCYQITVRDGRRRSAADAFLRPALARGNVELRTDAWVSRLLVTAGRARGVAYQQGGRRQEVHAAREVLLCGGAVNSPQLLQLSGIGDGARLQKLGIEVVHHSPAVGANLQDHLAVVYSFKATRPTLNNVIGSPLGQLLAGMRYLLTRGGPLALSVNQFGGFARANPEAPVPDVQLYCNPVTYSPGDAKRMSIKLDRFPGFYLCFQPTRPTSVGRIDISSADFRAPPAIAPNYLATDKDAADAVHGGRFLQRIARTRAMREWILAPLQPDLTALDDAGLLEDFRNRAATVYHPVGTCRMGPDAAHAVVDPQLRVHGLAGLRVVDASVFPSVTAANTNAPTLMVAQRAADMIARS